MDFGLTDTGYFRTITFFYLLFQLLAEIPIQVKYVVMQIMSNKYPPVRIFTFISID